jgi:hypothetical protein
MSITNPLARAGRRRRANVARTLIGAGALFAAGVASAGVASADDGDATCSSGDLCA